MLKCKYILYQILFRHWFFLKLLKILIIDIFYFQISLSMLLNISVNSPKAYEIKNIQKRANCSRTIYNFMG